jgi:hypothetical protein
LPARAARHKKGFRKISDFCDEAAARGIDWGWVDTCCIDKTDLIELSLAINSMYAWYRDSAICFAYLSDFQLPQRSRYWNEEDLGKSRWFKRGWTLQELIAPEYLVFYGSWWRPFGTKKELADVISKVTGIGVGLLRGQKSLNEYSCAQKMSWAAFRQTTRVEDRAYSLLGLFNICFPPLYGEGWKAFVRLQEAILKVSTDQSLFAWTQKGPFKPLNSSNSKDSNDWSLRYRCGILALTPECFHDSSSVICAQKDDTNHAHPRLANHLSGVGDVTRALLNRPMAITNTGLHIALLARVIKRLRGRCLLEVMLNCRHEYVRESKITIFLIAGVESSECKGQNSTVPAWRVEPYYLGSTRLSLDTVVLFDIHPIHAAWSTSFDVSQSPQITEEKYNQERQATKKRIGTAIERQTKADKAEDHREKLKGTCQLVGAAFVFGGLLQATRRAGNPKDSSNTGIFSSFAANSGSPVTHAPTTTWEPMSYGDYTTPKSAPAPKARYEYGGTFFE